MKILSVDDSRAIRMIVKRIFARLTAPCSATTNDVIGELCNMTVGNFKSNLCAAGLTCKLSPPKIIHTEDFQLNIVEGGTSQRYGFHSKETRLYADLSENPFSES